jgi:S1-C subfamily serine protease
MLGGRRVSRINGRITALCILILCAPLTVAAQSSPVIFDMSKAQPLPPPKTAERELRKDIPTIAKAANGAIVSIVMSDKDGQPIAQGTGFLVSKDGRILTNYHVIAQGSSAVVKLPDGAFFLVDGVLAFDKARDVALIKAHGDDFRTLALGNSDQLGVGDEVVAIGSPEGLESTVSNGIVSAIRADEEKGKLLQISAPISHGSSGGPLFNMAGEVVGITSSGIEEGENLNFAIPINDAKKLLLSPQKLASLPNEPMPNEAGAPEEAKETAPEQAPETDQQRCDETAAKYVHEYFVFYGEPPSGSYIVSTITRNHPVCYVAMLFTDGRIDIEWAPGALAWLLSPRGAPPDGEGFFAPPHTPSPQEKAEDENAIKEMQKQTPGFSLDLDSLGNMTCLIGSRPNNECNSEEEFNEDANFLFGLDMSKPPIPIH